MCQDMVIIMENIKQSKMMENNGRIIYIGYSWKFLWEVILWAETWIKSKSKPSRFLGVFCYLHLKASLTYTFNKILVILQNRVQISLLGSLPGPPRERKRNQFLSLLGYLGRASMCTLDTCIVILIMTSLNIFCWISTVGMQYYVTFRCTTYWFNIFIHYEMIALIGLVTSDTIESYFYNTDYIPCAVNDVPTTYIFYNWKFVPLSCPLLIHVLI